MDELIALLKSRLDVLKFLGRAWDLLYLESKSPDVGIRRENLIRLVLENELKLKVTAAPYMERSWDFSVLIGNKERFYSLKTSEGVSPIKIAWDGFPSIERARMHKFMHPILYVKNSKRMKELAVYVFDVDDLKRVRRDLGDRMWWMPRGGTNPRGYGIATVAVKKLMETAVKSGNYVSTNYEPLKLDSLIAEYWSEWYGLLKRLSRLTFLSTCSSASLFSAMLT